MIDLDEISDAELLATFRSKAEKYASLADHLEQKSFGPKEPLSLEAVKDLLSKQNYRVPGLAHALGTSEYAVKCFIEDPSNGLSMADRGWIKISPEPIPGEELL